MMNNAVTAPALSSTWTCAPDRFDRARVGVRASRFAAHHGAQHIHAAMTTPNICPSTRFPFSHQRLTGWEASIYVQELVVRCVVRYVHEPKQLRNCGIGWSAEHSSPEARSLLFHSSWLGDLEDELCVLVRDRIGAPPVSHLLIFINDDALTHVGKSGGTIALHQEIDISAPGT